MMYVTVNDVADVTVNVTIPVVAFSAQDRTPSGFGSSCANTKSGVEPKPCVTSAVVVAVVVDGLLTTPAVIFVGPSAISPARVAADCSSAV